MCGRFALSEIPATIRRVFGYKDQPNFPPRYNIAPTQPIATVRLENGERRFVLVRWGLVPGWVKDPADFSLLINARSETAAEKPAFRAAMRHRRCLIPANGFYEWQRRDGRKQPYWVAPKDGGLVAFAGLWESWAGPDGGDVETGAILTTAANAPMAEIHNRMPAVIAPEHFEAWLNTVEVSAKEASEMLRPAPEDLFEAVPVSTRVNAVANDDAALVAEIAPEEMVPAPEKKSAPKKKATPPPDDGQMSLL
ncbi:SOS response-associated peptidase [Rhodobium gokarnense]|uniref:Abasic site processing protein n=1 Tax=Rhodobium gokarnense TaxID=364296 RepID=A0ABT3HHY2_9HYPH|nr:SOS response-associated peptidase [Rhodobium gokarnense]MCW2309998.1 putative SOS response-associated peptidase YedK [Rhodobium gokarnense]